jgi:tagaturonate epimerase
MSPKNNHSACVTLGLTPSFGFGDRIGLATPGHVAAMQRSGNGIAPIFPQQSIREMTRTQRTPEAVMRDALNGAHQAGWTGPIGADADHLKQREDVEITAQAGFTFFTIDPSDMVDQNADDYSPTELRERFATASAQAPWYARYLGQKITLPTGAVIHFDEQACMRAAVKYGAAIERAMQLADDIQTVNDQLGRDYEIELSVDETDQPTTLAEHFIIAQQVIERGMKLVSLAPRFIGDLEKGVDYKGDLVALQQSLADHAAIAEQLGPYKLSLHSGSDKLSMYALLARATRGRFHVKTAGTSYLEALRVIARHDERLFRNLIRFARERYDTDRATYHVSATLHNVPDESSLSPQLLENVYLEQWKNVPNGNGFTEPGRQILHCTFGSTLTHREWGPAVRECLTAHPETYQEVLCDHFSRHLEALQSGLGI